MDYDKIIHSAYNWGQNNNKNYQYNTEIVSKKLERNIHCNKSRNSNTITHLKSGVPQRICNVLGPNLFD